MPIAADTVLRRGRVLVMNGSAPATAVAVRGGRVEMVGDDDAVARYIGPETTVIELAGRTVLPGLADVHCHLATNARDPRNAECRDFYAEIRSIDDILATMAAAASADHDEWVVGVGGFLQDLRLREGRLPTKAELDDATGSRPAYITFGPHLLVANSAALRAADVGPDTPDPQGGEIERDTEGSPTGVLRETAQNFVRSRRPRAGADLEERIYQELLACARRGVTTIHDVVKSPDEVRAYQLLEKQGRLPVRVNLLLRIFQSQLDTWSLLNLGLDSGFGSDTLRIGGIKVSVDGGDDKRTGFYPRPGDEARGFAPLLRMTEEDLDPILAHYHASGMQICVHAVGDMALDMALESFRRALAAAARDDHRHRIEHMGNFMLGAQQLQLAKELGIVPVPNPTSLHYVGAVAEQSLGGERTRDAFPFLRILESGVPFAIASDGPGLWPIDPLRDIATSVTRRTWDGGTMSEDQRISVEQGLAAMTRTAAWLGFAEDRLGTIEPGKLADLTILRADPLSLPPEQLPDIQVDLTMMNGIVTYPGPASVANGEGA